MTKSLGSTIAQLVECRTNDQEVREHQAQLVECLTNAKKAREHCSSTSRVLNE